LSWVADFHLHSHFSMATSKESNPKNLHRWAGFKGVSLLGTGDFTHPGWRKELREELVPAEPGFYRLKDTPASEIPGQPEVRFVVSGELSSIYKKNGRTRKVHNLILLPSLEDADRISSRLEELGMNIRSDGRPILGLDSYRLLELALDACPEVIFIPAHIWTPHFSVFGSNSGFDQIEECYEDLTQYIYALETGLSSDPGMNWRWSALDRFVLVSNSDAHNPQNLAREANLFGGEFSYSGIRKAFQDKETGGFLGTVEFFPEEGKYHFDGHRNCEVCWDPEQTRAKSGNCPVCGRKVTVGVLHRVAELADRPEGFRPEGAKSYQSLIPLREVIGSAIHAGVASRKVNEVYFDLLKQFGPELVVLREAEVAEIAKFVGPLVAEGIRRLRLGEVEIQPGYDGEYGVISVLREDDRQALQGQAALFEAETATNRKKATAMRQATAEVVSKARSLMRNDSPAGQYNELSPEQQGVVDSQEPLMMVIAGPGTGKTRTLVERVARLVRDGENPAEITGVTFTNKAAAEMKSRLGHVLSGDKRVNRLNLGTFHSIAWKILNRNPLGVCKLLDEVEARGIVEEILRQNRVPMTAREASLVISLIKNKYLWEDAANIPPAALELYEAYQQSLKMYGRWDFDDVILKVIELWEENPVWLGPFRKQFNHLLVDEFQDVNFIQYKLVKLWASENRSFLVIGDPNQSIYGFRGAASYFFDRLQGDCPGFRRFHLTRNYRSSAVVIRAANVFIEERYRQAIPPPGNDQPPPKIEWYETPGEKAACKAVANEIVGLLGGSTMLTAHGQAGLKKRRRALENSYGLSDIAILFRTGRQAEALETALTIEGLPYRVVGQTLTFEAPEVREFLAFFRYLTNPGDLFLFRSTLKAHGWGLSGPEVAEVVKVLMNQPAEAINGNLEQPGLADLPTELLNKLRQFYGVADYYRAQLGRENREIIGDWMLRMDLAQVEELEQLKRISENYRSMEEFLRFLPLALEADIARKGNKTTGTEAITLSTIHAAKGLEFPVVFMAGVEEGLLPLGLEPGPDEIAEEQRLFYVGLTRAEKQLILVSSQYRFRYGENTAVEVSRFLKQIPGDLLEKVEWIKQSQKMKQLELF
jgi:uncharacterized protein (TIGR00375 family)